MLRGQVTRALEAQGFALPDTILLDDYLNLRYQGTDTSGPLPGAVSVWRLRWLFAVMNFTSLLSHPRSLPLSGSDGGASTGRRERRRKLP